MQFGQLKRREFVTLLGVTAAAWPRTVRAQQAQGAPVIGFLHPGIPDSGSPVFDALREGLRESGYVEGDNDTDHHSLHRAKFRRYWRHCRHNRT
jgi:hypothetical protein